MYYINADTLGVITNMDPMVITTLMRTCKTLLKLVRSSYSKKYCRLRDTDITLRFLQCMLRDTFAVMDTGTILFQARKSFGKTIGGYACANKCGMVLLTTNLMKVWLTEAKVLGWYHANPELSKVLCFKIKKHWDYINKILAEGDDISNKEVILLVHDAQVENGIRFMNRIRTTQPKVLVVDEAHIPRAAVKEVQSACKWNKGRVFDKQLLLSADVMSPATQWINRPYRMVSVKQLDEVPEIGWNIIPLWESQEEWIDVFNRVVDQYNKVALVATKEQLDYIESFESDGEKKRRRNKEYRGARIFYQKTGMNTISNFNDWEDAAVLLINSIQNTGINVSADALLIAEAGITNSTRISQTVGRVVRTTNNVSVVKVYLCAKDEQAFIRCHYARCYYNEEWKYPFNTLPVLPYLKKCISIMNIFGTNVINVDSVDGCVIFADITMLEKPQEIVDWWQRNRTEASVLTENNVKVLMSL